MTSLAPTMDRAELLRQRGAGMLAALAVEAALFVLLLAPWSRGAKTAPEQSTLSVFEVQPQPPPPPPPPEINPAQKSRRVEDAGTRSAPPKIPLPLAPLPPPPVTDLSTFMRPAVPDPIALDIGQTQSTIGGGNSDGIGSGGKGSAGAGSGTAPRARRAKPAKEIKLVYAEWYRRPTPEELGRYITSREVGWGAIMCRTAPEYRVRDCRERGEYPRGSGFSHAVRAASWQFRVRPVTLDGQDQFDAWVLIRIDINTEQKSPSADAPG